MPVYNETTHKMEALLRKAGINIDSVMNLINGRVLVRCNSEHDADNVERFLKGAKFDVLQREQRRGFVMVVFK